MKTIIEKIIDDHIKAIQFLNEREIIKIAEIITDAFRNGKKIILFGNGGSASDCEHIAAEFVGRFKKNRVSLPAITLVSSGPLLTSIGNDFAFENIFSRQIPAMVYEGDVCIGLSTSGKSKNVLLGLKEAKERGCITILITGKDILTDVDIIDEVISVHSSETARIQEIHILIGHMICELVEYMLGINS